MRAPDEGHRTRLMPLGHTPISLDAPQTHEIDSVGAMIVDEGGRYLMQLRDDIPGLPLRGHWAMFGGFVEPGEDLEAAVRREVAEELGHVAGICHWYSESVFVLPRDFGRVVHRVWYVIPVTAADIAAMRLREGADMRAFSIDELLALPAVAPWDLAVAVMHARHERLFRL